MLFRSGTSLSAEDVIQQWNQPMSAGIKSGMTLEQWKRLRDAPDNDPALKPEAIPARQPPVMERFFNSKYNFIGVFKPPEARAELGIGEGLLRVSVGLEDVEDIKEDLAQALAA